MMAVTENILVTDKRGVPMPKAKASVPHPVDVHVGQRIKMLRKMRKLSQAKLGEFIGLTFQQIQKYEHGTNRVGASRLHQFSQILDVPVSFFFDDMPVSHDASHLPPVKISEPDPYNSAEVQELLRAFHAITDPRKRRAISDMAKSLCEPDAKSDPS